MAKGKPTARDPHESTSAPKHENGGNTHRAQGGNGHGCGWETQRVRGWAGLASLVLVLFGMVWIVVLTASAWRSAGRQRNGRAKRQLRRHRRLRAPTVATRALGSASVPKRAQTLSCQSVASSKPNAACSAYLRVRGEKRLRRGWRKTCFSRLLSSGSWLFWLLWPWYFLGRGRVVNGRQPQTGIGRQARHVHRARGLLGRGFGSVLLRDAAAGEEEEGHVVGARDGDVEPRAEVVQALDWLAVLRDVPKGLVSAGGHAR